MEPVNSTTFIKRPPHSEKRDNVLSKIKDILQNRLFLGCYDERRHVPRLNEYRDVITVSPTETELIADLDTIIQILASNSKLKWVGITGPGCEGVPNGHCLWVKLVNIPFGRFWFQIKQIKCEQGEIILRLKCIRPVRDQDHEEPLKDSAVKSQESVSTKSSDKSFEYVFDFNPAQKLTSVYIHLNDTIRQVGPHITWNNFLLICKFVVAIALVLVTAILTCVRHLGDYVLRLIRELTLLLQAITPVLVQAIDCLTKTIGGFFILIALILKNRKVGSQQLENQFLPMERNPPLPQIKEAPLTSPTNNPSSSIVPPNWRERNRNLKMQLRF